MGRPKIKLSDFKRSWQEDILKMMSEGASQFEVQAYLDISDCTFYRLCKEEKDFSSTITRGRRLGHAWWEKKGRKNLSNPKFQHQLWFLNMKNRFTNNWRDRKEVGHDGGEDKKGNKLPINIKKASDEEIDEYLIAKTNESANTTE